MIKVLANGRRRKPKQERARFTVEAIVEAAAQVLETHGFEGANTNLIAQRAGVSVGTLYEYFADKEALTQEVLQCCLKGKLKRMQMEAAALEGLSFQSAVRRLLEVFLREVTRQYNLTRVLLGRSLYVSFHQESPEIIEGVTALVNGILLKFRHELRPANSEIATFIFFHSIDAIMDAVLLEKPDYLHDPAFLDELTTLFCHYFLPSGSVQGG